MSRELGAEIKEQLGVLVKNGNSKLFSWIRETERSVFRVLKRATEREKRGLKLRVETVQYVDIADEPRKVKHLFLDSISLPVIFPI